MKYFIITAQVIAILYLFLDLFEVVNVPSLRVMAYTIIFISLLATLVFALMKSKKQVQ